MEEGHREKGGGIGVGGAPFGSVSYGREITRRGAARCLAESVSKA